MIFLKHIIFFLAIYPLYILNTSMLDTLKKPPCTLTLSKKGADRYTKISYPLRYGIYSELETKNALFHFNLNHEIIRAVGKGTGWIHPSEWLKRNMGNDWIYYSTGGYTGVFEATGEYYLPNFPYPTNAILGGKPLEEPAVQQLTHSWHNILSQLRNNLLRNNLNGWSDEISHFLDQALANTPEKLEQKAQAFFRAAGGRVTVLPPDARHVDYDIIPLPISKGCLYKCKFCRIKSKAPFSTLTQEEILTHITRLKKILNKDLINYNSIFLGEHDALAAGEEPIIFAAKKAHNCFNLANSYMKESRLFLFGSVDSFLDAPTSLFDRLDNLPYLTFINIGLESADQETLDHIGKPITVHKVTCAFKKMQEINRDYRRVEITANFIMDDALPGNHEKTFLNLVRESLPHVLVKGTIYLSPLRIGKPSREVLFKFNRLKILSRLPTFLYIIQRL